MAWLCSRILKGLCRAASRGAILQRVHRVSLFGTEGKGSELIFPISYAILGKTSFWFSYF